MTLEKAGGATRLPSQKSLVLHPAGAVVGAQNLRHGAEWGNPAAELLYLYAGGGRDGGGYVK